MEDFISVSAKKLAGFLSKNIAILKENRNFLISFAVQTDNLILKGKIDYLIKHYEKSFYFEQSTEDFLILGLDEALSFSENGSKRFSSTDKRVRELRNHFISNWDDFEIGFPLFVGAMKFNTEHSKDIWNDYPDSIWFIPEITILKKKEKTYLLYNFLYNSSADNSVDKFKSKVETVFQVQASRFDEATRIDKISGSMPKEKKKWKKLVENALEKIYENEIKKIVLSRQIEIVLSNELNFDFVLADFKEKYQECYLFFFHIGKSTFFGATPEKLAKFYDGKIELEALAGSAPRGKNNAEDSAFENLLLQNKKDLEEHNFVIDHIKDSMSNLSEEITIRGKIKVRKFANIQHLHTPIEGKINSKNIPFEILKELFPTPAVCGFPKDASLSLIKKLETHNRGLYSGIIGWFNFNAEGEFAIALRSALTSGNKLFAYAGSGIVEGSEPDLEFDETELKFKPILNLLNEN